MTRRYAPFQAATFPPSPAGPAGQMRTWALRLALLLAALGLLRVGLMLASQASLHVDEAQYWDWSRQLQWGYYSKPPVVAALIRASTTLFGDSELGLRLLSMLCWPLTAGVLALLGVVLTRASQPQASADPLRVGTTAALIWLCSPLAGLLGLAVTTDTPLLLCWALALYALWQAVALRRHWGWALLALALGVGLLDKYTMAALLPGALLWLLWQGRARDLLGLVAAGVGALALLSPNLLWNAAADWPTLRHTADITVRAAAHGKESGSAPLRVLGYLLGQVVMLGPLLVLGALGWRVSRIWCKPEPTAPVVTPLPLAAWSLLLCTSLPLLAVGLLQAARGHAEINWIAPVHLALTLGLAHGALRVRRRGALALLLGLQLGLISTISVVPAWIAASQPKLAAAIDPWRRQRGWDEAFAQLAPALHAQAGGVLVSDGRSVLAQAAYHLRGSGVRRAAWTPQAVAENHYQLTCPWRPGTHAPGPVWVLTEGPPAAELIAVFGRLEPVAQAPVLRLGREFSRLYLSRAPQAQDPAAPAVPTCP